MATELRLYLQMQGRFLDPKTYRRRRFPRRAYRQPRPRGCLCVVHCACRRSHV